MNTNVQILNALFRYLSESAFFETRRTPFGQSSVSEPIENDQEWKTPKACFSGEGDSNQSKFEKQSNHLKIGVLASSETEGKMLLAMLRAVVDENLEGVLNMCGYDVKPSTSYEEIVAAWKDIEDGYFTSFDLDEEFTCELIGWHGTTEIRTNYSNVDLWTRKRLISAFIECVYDLFDEEELEHIDFKGMDKVRSLDFQT